MLATGVALLVAASAASAAGTPLHGTFKTVIKNAPSAQLDGTWQIALLPTGRYTIQRNGTVLIRGRDTETATMISSVVKPAPRRVPERSVPPRTVGRRAGLLRLTTVREGCFGRHVVLTTHPLKKIG